MNERPLPDDGRISDELSEAIAPLFPNPRTAIASAAGRPSLLVAMPGREERPLPFRFTRNSLLFVGAAFLISLCLFWYGTGSVIAMANPIPGAEAPKPLVQNSTPFFAVLAGGSLLGAALGAVVGKACLDDKGIAHITGAFVGALVGPLVVLILLVEFAFFFGGAISV
jgi:hypothetical protein